MKKQTKAQRFQTIAKGVASIRRGETPKKLFRKDGSVATKPCVPVDSTKSEAQVMEECIRWLRKHGIQASRMNVGFGSMGGKSQCTYGIVGGGDLFCILPFGRHLEVECKAGKGGVWKKSQQDRCNTVRRMSACYIVVHGVEELEHYSLSNWS